MHGEALGICDLAVAGVRDLQAYQPGRAEAEVARQYGVDDVVKLASNENPLGPSPAAAAAVRAAAADMHRYPDGAARELRTRLAAHHRLAAERVTLGNGSNDVLDLIARAFLGPGRSAVFSRHAFAIFAIATQTVGAEGIAVPALSPRHASAPYGHDLEAIRAAVCGNTRVVFIANPNNPTGSWLTARAVADFLASVPSEVLLVLDEAYVEYATDCPGYRDARALLETYPNLIVTRSFSKAFGLAGLRAGYALSHPQVADLLNRARHPFNINALAQAAAAAALDDTDHIERAVALNTQERTRVAEGLAALGLRCLPSAGNFLCVELGDEAAAVNEALLRAGVIVRPLAGYGLPRCVRVSLGLAAENDRFLAALGACGNRLERTA